jgi:hypothetical protein
MNVRGRKRPQAPDHFTMAVKDSDQASGYYMGDGIFVVDQRDICTGLMQSVVLTCENLQALLAWQGYESGPVGSLAA